MPSGWSSKTAQSQSRQVLWAGSSWQQDANASARSRFGKGDDCIAQEYKVPEELVQADLIKLLRDLQRQQLLVCQLPPSQALPSPPSPLTTSLLLKLAWISIRILGWTKTIWLWRLWQRPINLQQ